MSDNRCSAFLSCSYLGSSGTRYSNRRRKCHLQDNIAGSEKSLITVPLCGARASSDSWVYGHRMAGHFAAEDTLVWLMSAQSDSTGSVPQSDQRLASIVRAERVGRTG